MQALEANYWKPVQAGDLEYSDSDKVRDYAPAGTVLNEAFRLKTPMSPHAAANIDGVKLTLADLTVPEVEGNLVIEGAGGLMVPLDNDGLTYADVFEAWKLPVVVVSRHYLGSINHTLLTIEALKRRSIPIAGIIFVGDEHETTEKIIKDNTGVPVLIRIPMSDEVNADFVKEQAERLKAVL